MRGTDRRWTDRALWAALGTVIAGSLLLLLSFGYGRDQGIYAVVGRAVLAGDMPYRDAWDFKPPGIFLVYALARGLFGPARWAIRVLEVLLMLAAVASMIALGRRWWKDARIGALAGALASLVLAQLDFWHTAQPESFGGMLSMIALWLGSRERAPRRQLAAGAIFGFTGLLKPPLAGGGALLGLWLARRSRSITPAGWMLLGGALPLIGCGLWFWLRGAWSDLVEVLFEFTPHYTALGWHGRSFGQLLLESIRHAALDYSAPIAVGAALALLLHRRMPHREGMLLLSGIVLLQLVGVALQGKFFPYHYAGCWPAAAMLAAAGWWQLGRMARAPWARAAVGALLVATAPLRTATKDVDGHFWWRSAYRMRLYLLGRGDETDRDRLASVADIDAAASRRLAAELRRRVPPDGALYVWGFEPAIYDASDRRSASRYIYNVPQRAPWWRERGREQLMRELDAAAPEVIVVASGDPLPMVTGDGVDSAGALEDFEALSAFLARRYGALMQLGRFTLHVRRDEQP